MADLVVPPSTYIASVVADVLHHGERLSPAAFWYEEKPGGFQCRTCVHARPLVDLDPWARCEVLAEPVHLEMGCCVAWTMSPETLEPAERPPPPAETL